MEESTAGPGKRRQPASAAASGPVAPHIPDELVRNILLRLPSKSVIRFSAVCKAWREIVSHPEFAVDHHRLQPTLPLISLLRDTTAAAGTKADTTGPTEDCCVDAFDLGAGGGSFRPVVRFTDKGGGGSSSVRIHGSCDGLLLLSYEDYRFYVCNPATHQWTRLPTPLRGSAFAGFYRHDPTGEYRALFYLGVWPGANYYILVPDARKGKGIGLPAEKGDGDGYKFRGQPYGSPVLLRGHLHWMPRQKAEVHGILKLNTSTELPTAMCPPVIREHMSLAEVGGELAMVSCGNSVAVVELWILKDYENQIWVCMHRIRLPAVSVSAFKFDENWRMFFFMSEEGVVIVTTDMEQKLVHYDMNGTLLESFPCGDNNGRHLKIAPYTFQESLVRHEFFEREDGNAGDHEDGSEPPPFFQGL